MSEATHPLGRFAAHLVDSRAEADRFIDWLKQVLSSGQPIGIDTETRSVHDLWKPGGPPFMRLYQIGTAYEGWAVPAEEWFGVVREAHDLVLQARSTPVIGANFGFDQHVFVRSGLRPIPWRRLRDTVIEHRIVRSHHKQHGLKPAAVSELGPWAGAGQSVLHAFMRENSLTWDTIPTNQELYWAYGVFDCCLSVLLDKALMPELQRHYWVDVEMEYQRICWGMEARGVCLDPAAVEHADAVWSEMVLRAEQELKLLGFHKPSSSKAVITAFEALGFEPWEFSEKTGDPTYNKMVLARMQDMGEPIASAAKQLIVHRKYTAWRNNYGRKLLNYMYDGRIHPSINTMQARTWRSSITNPPLQTIPKTSITRNMFIPDEGMELWAVDYSSQEIRVQAGLSMDEAMLAFFEGDNDDYHQYVADMARIPRSSAKTVNYARAYGAGPEKLAASAGVTVSEMRGYLSQIDRAFPRAMKWKDEVTHAAEMSAQRDGYPSVELPYGVRVALDAGHEFTQAANTIIQGHGAMVLKLAAARVAAEGLEDHLVLPVHDEFLLQAPVGEGEEVARTVAEIMVDNRLPVPLVTDVTGPLARWGEAVKEDK